MPDAFTQYETLLRENISPVVTNLVLEDQDPAWDLIGTFQPETLAGRRDPQSVTPGADIFPPGYEASWRIKVQRGGRVAGGTFAGNAIVMMGANAHLAMGQASNAKYLDPALTPLPSWIVLKMLLTRIIGSLTKNQQQVLAQLASQPIDQVAGEDLEDATAHFRNLILNGLYGDGTGAIALVNETVPTQPVETAGGVTVEIDGGTWGRFEKGDLIVFADSSYTLRTGDGAIGSKGLCRVVDINPDSRNIKVQSIPGVGTLSGVADNDFIILADTYDFDASALQGVTEGFESLLINSGTYPGSVSQFFPGGLDVANHSELRAFIDGTDGTNENPTMDVLTEILDKIDETGKTPPNAIISERGVWTLYNQMERSSHGTIQIPMGQPFVAAGGTAGPVMSHNEHRFSAFRSKRIRPNSMIGINASTWKKFMPMGDRAIHWVAGTGVLAGFGSIYLPISSGTQLTESAQALFNGYCQFGCTDPRANFRRLGIRAQRDV